MTIGATGAVSLVVDSTLFENNGQILGVNPALTVSEPSTWAMLLAGFAALSFGGHRRARVAASAA